MTHAAVDEHRLACDDSDIHPKSARSDLENQRVSETRRRLAKDIDVPVFRFLETDVFDGLERCTPGSRW